MIQSREKMSTYLLRISRLKNSLVDLTESVSFPLISHYRNPNILDCELDFVKRITLTEYFVYDI